MTDVERYQAEAEALRHRIANSVDALGERLRPSRLVQDAKDEGMRTLLGVRDDGMERMRRVRDNGARALYDIGDRGADAIDAAEAFVRENPLAATAAAAFVGVLIIHNRPRRAGPGRPDYDVGESYAASATRPVLRARRYAEHVSEAIADTRGRLGKHLSTLGDKTADAFADARAKVSTNTADLADRARATLHAARSRSSAAASDAADRIAAGLDSARDTSADAVARARRAALDAAKETQDAIRQQPEAAIAVGLILGACLALAAEDGALDPQA